MNTPSKPVHVAELVAARQAADARRKAYYDALEENVPEPRLTAHRIRDELATAHYRDLVHRFQAGR